MASDRKTRFRRVSTECEAARVCRWVRQAAIGWILFSACCGSTGCRRSAEAWLLGEWVGRPPSSTIDGNEVATSPLLVEVRLTIKQDGQFEITLRDPQGGLDRREGRYEILRAYGSRREVRLMAESPQQVVTLAIVFQGRDRMIAREVNGDSRLDQFVFQRLGSADAKDASSSAADSAPGQTQSTGLFKS